MLRRSRQRLEVAVELSVEPDWKQQHTAIYPYGRIPLADLMGRFWHPRLFRCQTIDCCHGLSFRRRGCTPPRPVQRHRYDSQIPFILTLKQCGDGLQWNPRPCRRFQLQRVITYAKGSTCRGFTNHVTLSSRCENPSSSLSNCLSGRPRMLWYVIFEHSGPLMLWEMEHF